MRRVDAFDVEGGIGFGVAERLRFRQRIGKLPSFLGHRAEDEVGGAIDDAGEPLMLVGGQ